MKQTAVEWLVEQLNEKIDFIPLDKWDMIRDIIQQAKSMEKQQMLGCYFAHRDFCSGEVSNDTFNQHYEQAYGGKVQL